MILRKPHLSLLAAVGACLSMLPGSTPARAETLYSWPAVPGAAYYSGRVRHADEVDPVQTRDTWLMLESGTVLWLYAYDAHGRRLKDVSATIHLQFPRSAPPPQSLPPSPPPPVTLAPPPAPGPKATKRPPKPKTPAADAADDDAAGESAKADPRHKKADPARLGLSLGLGSEHLNANGGISNYQGSSNVGSTTVTGEWTAPGAAFFTLADLAAHNFNSQTVVQAPDGSQNISQSRLLHLEASLLGYYDLLTTTPAFRLGLGIGPAYERLPLLTLSDSQTATGTLTDQAGKGLAIGAAFAWHLSQTQQLTVGLRDVFTSFGPVTYRSRWASGAWRYRFVKFLDSEVAVESATTTAKEAFNCMGLNGCTNPSAIVSKTVQGRFGLGYEW